jgi:hypothetical protein
VDIVEDVFIHGVRRHWNIGRQKTRECDWIRTAHHKRPTGEKAKREPRLVPGTSKQDTEARGRQNVRRLPVVQVAFLHQITVGNGSQGMAVYGL